jgi:formiminoglutamase
MTMDSTIADILKVYNKAKLESFYTKREGEQKLGDRIQLLSGIDPAEAKYALIGVPECIGPVANHGKPGCETAWHAFLPAFLNMQSNRFTDGRSFVLVGELDTADLMKEYKAIGKNPEKLRPLVSRLDLMVERAVSHIYDLDLTPILIGGGHNNAYPLLKAASANFSQSVNCINCDPHADYRLLEGRHSGNSFSYAKEEGLLDKYAVIALSRAWNDEEMLKRMEQDPDIYLSFEGEDAYFSKTIQQAIRFVKDDKKVTALELDMDVIAEMPVSALSPSGLSLNDCRLYIREVVSSLKPAYLHLPEAAPATEREAILAGKSLALLVCEFANAYKSES